MATKIAVMDTGVIQQVGTPDEIYDTPENLFVADFVGSPAMNMLDCVIGEANGARRGSRCGGRHQLRPCRLPLEARRPRRAAG